MAVLAAAAPFIAAAGAALSAASAIQQGRAADAASKFEANQMRQQAKAVTASSQREALEGRRQFDLAQGSARAQAAASGAGLASPTISNILGGLEYESDFAFDKSIGEGLEKAKGLNLGADVRRIEGKQARKAGYMKAAAEVASFAGSKSGQTLFDKYVPKGTK